MTNNTNNRPKPFILIIADGMGVAPPGPGNAVTLAQTPNLDKFWFKYPHCYLHASGSAVGLPSGTNGNSEVGHINIGAGKVVFQELPRIDKAIANKTFFSNQTLIELTHFIKNNNGTLHIMGLMSNGRTHSSLEHAFASIELAQTQGLKKDQVAIHAFTDGRDTPPKSAATYLEELEAECSRKNIGTIASIVGRYYAMDRDERWERIKLAYDLLTKGEGKKFNNWKDALQDAYNGDETDEFIKPRVLTDKEGTPRATVKEGDGILFINYRADRAIQLSEAFIQEDFSGWDREKKYSNLFYVGMNEYEDGFPQKAAFPPENISLPIGRVLSDSSLRQLRIAESEKFPHVTYFINGGNEIIYPGEDRIEIPSPQEVATYDQKPEMSVRELTEVLISKINEKIYDFIVLNIANPDMVGHTGDLEATIKAVEVTDECLGRVMHTVLSIGGAGVIIADHGNAEELINLQTGEVDTEHSTNPVPFIYVNNNQQARELSFGILADITPTILAALGIQKPSTMTGRNLLI